MHAPTRRGAVLALAAAALAASLSACGSSGAPAGTLPKVAGQFGGAPTITFPNASPPSTLKVKVLRQGTGPVVQPGDLLIANYVGQIWQGKVFDSSFSRHLATAFPIGVHRVIPGWDDSLVGVRAGSRLLLVVPPVDGYGAAGNPGAGITATDTLTFVVDVIASYSRTSEGQRATHLLHTDVDGVTVNWPVSTPPSLLVPPGLAAPKAPSVTVLSTGGGRRIAPGLVVLQFVVVNAKTGKVLQSTWTSGLPNAEPVGNPASPSVLDRLVGLRIGSRLLLRLPKMSNGGPYVFAMDLVAEPSLSG
jgi:peptidylprolyl isomerase